MSIGKLVLFGNDPKCSRCNKFKPEWNSKAFVDFAKTVGAERIDAGMTLDKKTYDIWMAKAKVLKVKVVAFPDLMILDKAGKVIGHFTPSGTAKSVIDKIKKLCPDCCTDGSCEIEVPPVVVPPVIDDMVVCPTCNGTGKVKKTAKKR
jgi:hypothetical protein